jgi:hypothetical protein
MDKKTRELVLRVRTLALSARINAGDLPPASIFLRAGRTVFEAGQAAAFRYQLRASAEEPVVALPAAAWPADLGDPIVVKSRSVSRRIRTVDKECD